MILDREEREADLATKSDVSMTLQLTDKQYEALLHYTFKAGLKRPEELLESFIGDLSGWHRNGSDEEEKADEWFQRAYGGFLAAAAHSCSTCIATAPPCPNWKILQ